MPKFNNLSPSQQNLFKQEWLISNSLGSYASSTIINANTRKYHGFLIANLPAGKYVMLANLDQLIYCENKVYNLSTNSYQGEGDSFIYPEGFTHWQEFKSDPIPKFQYQLDPALKVTIYQEIILAAAEDTVLIRYKINNPQKLSLKLELKPLLAFSHFHENSQRKNFMPSLIEDNLQIRLVNSELPSLFLQGVATGKITKVIRSDWYYNFYYLREHERGFYPLADYFCPGYISCELDPQEEINEIILIASLKPYSPHEVKLLWKQEYNNHTNNSPISVNLTAPSQLKNINPQELNWAYQTLLKRTEDFIYYENQEPRIIAGFPWFGSWGRDSFISLPGLLYSKSNYSLAVEIIETYLKYRKNGLIPNYFDTKDPNHIAYNSCDAPLWLAWAVKKLYLKDKKTITEKIYLGLVDILNNFSNNSTGLTKLLENGLLYAGDEDTQLTWMDAKAYGNPITPRYGLAVEINALWYNLVALVLELAVERHRKYKALFDFEIINQYLELEKKIKLSFNQVFWQEEFLSDVVIPERDLYINQLRPNQLVALALDYPLISKAKAKLALKLISNLLLTPCGLRSLAPNDPQYKGAYTGNEDERALAYHNGSIWPWLLGFYTEACLKNDYSLAPLIPVINHLPKLLNDYGINTLGEIFSGEPPHAPNGCISQAWSVAEALRMLELLFLKA